MLCSFGSFLFIFTGSIDILVFMTALHSFLLIVFIYSGLLLIVGLSLFSHQGFALDLCSASFWVLSLIISIICMFMTFSIYFFRALCCQVFYLELL